MYGSTHAVIGNYRELNPKDCGITRLTDGFDDMCFEWNKNPVSAMKNARDVTKNEVPWIVGIGGPKLEIKFDKNNREYYYKHMYIICKTIIILCFIFSLLFPPIYSEIQLYWVYNRRQMDNYCRTMLSQVLLK